MWIDGHEDIIGYNLSFLVQLGVSCALCYCGTCCALGSSDCELCTVFTGETESCQVDVVSAEVSSSCDTVVAILSWEHCSSWHFCAITAPGLLCSDSCQDNKCFLLSHTRKEEIYSQKLNWLFIDQINEVFPIWLFPCSLKGVIRIGACLWVFISLKCFCLPQMKTQNN